MRKLLNNKIIVVFILSSLGTACRKDKPIPEPPIDVVDTTTTNCDTCITCDDFPPAGELGYGYFSTGTQYTAPCFNPNNENEFIYLRKDGSNSTELCKYDLSLKTETVLCNSIYITSSPQWGVMGKIVFNSINSKVWKINEDGSSLIQLTFEEKDIHPNFNYDGDLIYYYRGKNYTNYQLEQNPSLHFRSLMMIIDLNGNKIDSITAFNTESNNYYQNWYFGDFTADKVYFKGGTYNNHGIYSLDLNSQVISNITSWTDNTKTIDLDYGIDKIYFTFRQSNIYVTNINNGSIEIYKEGCDTKSYAKISISPDGNNMLVEKVINTPIIHEFGAVDIDEQHEIWLIDLVDKTETQILGE